jgi:hypothetical protein
MLKEPSLGDHRFHEPSGFFSMRPTARLLSSPGFVWGRVASFSLFFEFHLFIVHGCYEFLLLRKNPLLIGCRGCLPSMPSKPEQVVAGG